MSYVCHPAYPTPQHARSAEAVTEFFAGRPGVEAVLLTCSCARGKATPDSCLDVDILLDPALPAAERAALETVWEQTEASHPVFAAQRQVGVFSQVDLGFTTAQFNLADHPHGWTSGADAFELEVGNFIAYSVPLWERAGAFQTLRRQWLPYYNEELRLERLNMVRGYCRNNLAHIPLYIRRGLYFQSFKRLYQAFEEFLQALFIARRTYPIAYDKHVREQIVEILALPELYTRLVHILEIPQFESDLIATKAQDLESLLQEYTGG